MLKKAIFKYKWMSMAILSTGMLISLCSVSSILFYQLLVDAITKGLALHYSAADLFQYILSPLTLYAIFTLGDCIFNYLEEYPGTRLNNSVYQYFRISAVEKISKVDYKSLQHFGTGRIIQIVENGASAGRDIIMNFYISIFGHQLPRLLFSLFVLGAYNLQIMLIIGIGYIIVFFITKLLIKKLYLLKSDTLVNQEFMSKRFVICLMEIVTFRVNRLYKREIKQLEANAAAVTKNTTKIRMIHEAFFTIFYLIIIVIKISVIVMSVTVSKDVTIGMIVAMVALIDNIYNPIAIFNVAYVDYNLNKITFDRYKDFMALPEDTNLFQGKPFDNVTSGINLENLSFRYDEKTVVDKVNINIKPGKSVALVGESGSGKSTIIKMIMGLIKYSEGSISVNETQLKDLNLNTFYEKITYVSQDTPVFDGSIRRNIVFDKEVSDKDIHAVLSLVKLDQFIKRQPQGLDTEIGEKGIKLSGGEKQRIALARVFFDESSLVILDEATSGMDYITEEFVIRNLYRNASDKTLIMVAHRLNIIKDFDTIIAMRDGQVVQTGSFDELIGDTEGYFYALWKKQKSFMDSDYYEAQ